MPELDAKQLLLHQFVAGLPSAISKQLRSTASATELRSMVECAEAIDLAGE